MKLVNPYLFTQKNKGLIFKINNHHHYHYHQKNLNFEELYLELQTPVELKE